MTENKASELRHCERISADYEAFMTMVESELEPLRTKADKTGDYTEFDMEHADFAIRAWEHADVLASALRTALRHLAEGE